ncbi:hypothetical protein BDV24DRAFT_156115 [Aspergillus arachidicola]|uniref:Integral membrane protein TmpA n=1 Tax=Aspergillus arachidicola TaxID=656916 RepID=A0A5N6XQ95_9EURO|nr:hypothetical protein BDV24DRAFT_156115 [Aspergillus arachidicola]
MSFIGPSKSSILTSIGTYPKHGTTEDWNRYSTNWNCEAQQPPRKCCTSVRFLILTVYRRLFSLVYCANAVAFIIVMVKSRERLLAFMNAAVINLLVCSLAHHPLEVNIIFASICRIPHGCGIASVLWYVGLVTLLSREYCMPSGSRAVSLPVITLSYILLVNLVVVILVAYPIFRTKKHDYFELTHRFGAWLAVALFLTLLLIFSSQPQHAEISTFGQYVAELPAFWIALVVVASLVHLWLLLRRVKVSPEHLSPHAIRLHLNHTSTAFGKVIALSMHPLQTWHSFATFPDPNGQSFSCIVSRAGDWTSQCIDQPPTYLWKRGILMYGFIHVMRVFRRVVVVATGSGIGPCLSWLNVLKLVRQLDSDPIIIDTNTRGRVDMVPVVRGIIQEFDAEAVCDISNAFLTKKIIFELRASGVPAFGPIFDS